MKKILSSKVFNDKKLIIISAILGLILGIFQVFGYQLEEYGNVNLTSATTYGKIILFTLSGSILTMGGLVSIEWLNRRLPVNNQRKKSLKNYFVVMGVLLLLWAPQALGVYPGYFNYDAPGQWDMYIYNKVTAHHPVLHTMMLGWIIEFFII